MTKAANPASPKTNPASGLFSRKDFPFDSGAPVEGGAVVEVVPVVVVCPFGAGVGGAPGKLPGLQHPDKNSSWLWRTWG